MRGRWQKLVAILGVTALVVGQNGGMLVRADEFPTDGEDVITTVEDESADEESSVQEEATEQKSTENSEEKTETSFTEEESTTEVSSTEEITEDKSSEVEESTVEETSIEEETTEEETTEEYGIALLAEDTTTDEVQAVINLRWSDETPGEAIFYNPNEGNVSFVMHYYHGDQSMGTWSTSQHGVGDVRLPIYDDIFESGEYTFKVETFPYGVEEDYDLSSGYISEESPTFNYTRPSAQLETPKNISWSTDGVVSWDAVDHATSYWSYLAYADDNSYSGYQERIGRGWSGTFEDYSDEMASGYEYYARVRAVSENINLYANSDYSDWIAFDGSTTVDKTNDKLDEAIGDGVTTENAQAVVDAVKESFADDAAKGELQVAMQTDTETQEKIKNLEDAYKESMGLTTAVKPSEDTGIDASSVSLLGAALNATKTGSVTFNMTKPDEETQKDLITNSRFTKAIVLDLELEGAGIEKGKTLAIPVTVTMAAPEGIDISKLTILHYNADGTYETLPVRKNSDGTISFTVTHFSNFVFGEKQQASESSSNGSNNSSSNSHSSSDGGSTTVYVPSWKPTTPDEIKRYSFFSKEKVDYVADVANAYPVKVVNALQGKLCFDVFEAVLGDYTIGRTYNIFPSNKAVYKMDSTAKITLSIPKALQASGREYKMICVTQKGLPIVLEDIDVNPNTITFETDSYYAFALVYKDAVDLQ